MRKIRISNFETRTRPDTRKLGEAVQKKKPKRRQRFKLRHPWLIRIASFASAWLVRNWIGTLNYRLANLDSTAHPADPRQGRFIYALWHETILFLPLFRGKVNILISQHPDGEFITQVSRFLGADVVRGSTTHGGVQALMDMLECSTRTHLMVTPDGPQGPRRRVQLGLIFLASFTGLPIVPCGVGYANAWRARSWDKLALPLPWSTGRGIMAPAISIPPNLTRQQLEHYRTVVEEAMLKTIAAAENWANGQPLDTRELRSAAVETPPERRMTA